MKTKLIITNGLTGEEILVARFKNRNEAIQVANFLQTFVLDDYRRYAVDTKGIGARYNA
jgi:hypothetical protein